VVGAPRILRASFISIQFKLCSLAIIIVPIPTSASHDGISSPFVSLRGNSKPYSIKVETPIEIIADLNIISNAPYKLLASGCGDLIAKITAIKDWKLARDDTGEYFGEYAANLAYLGAKMILDISKNIIKNQIDIQITRTIVEGLISSGVAAGIAGSSRPCSGSEHLFSHALEHITNGKSGLHGERVGILMNGFFKLFAVILPISMQRPPPIPIIISIFSFFSSFSIFSTL